MEFPEALDRIGTGAVIIGAGFIIGSVLEYGVKVVMARFLGPDQYGVFLQGVAVIEVLAVIGLIGLHRGLPRFISYYQGNDNLEAIQNAIRTAALISIVGGIAVAASVYLSASFIAVLFNEPALYTTLQLFAIAVLPLALFYLGIGMIRGIQNATYKIYITDAILPVSQLLLLLLLFKLGYGVDGAIYAYAFGVSIAAASSYYYFRKLTDYTASGRFEARELLRFSWPLMVVSIIIAVNRWIDVLMLGWLTDSAAVGVYEVAMAISGMSAIFLHSLNYMYMPVVSELFSSNSIQTVTTTYRTATRWVYILSLPVLAGFLIFPHEILLLLFGEAYTGGALVLAILAIGYFFSSSVGPAGTTLIAIGRTKLFMLSMLLQGVGDIVLNLLLIPEYGIVGAAIAMTAALILANISMVFFVHRTLGTQPYSLQFIRPGVVALLVSAPIYLVTTWVSLPLYGSVFAGIVLVVAYLGLSRILHAFQDDDLAVLKRLLTRTPVTAS